MCMQAQVNGSSILPNIMDVALKHNVSFSTLQILNRPDEKRAVCPFHVCTTHKDKVEYHLYINTEKNTFKCFSCGEKGGVVRFISLLEGIPEQRILEGLREPFKNKGRRNFHPAERLNSLQLKKLGFLPGSWSDFKRKWVHNPVYIRNTMDYIWGRWRNFVNYRIEMAYKELLIGLNIGRYKETIEKIKKESLELGEDILGPVLKIYSSPIRPAWTVEITKLAGYYIEAFQKTSPPAYMAEPRQGMKGEKNV